MFHDASREWLPRDPRTLHRSVTGVDEVSLAIRKHCREAVYDASHPGDPASKRRHLRVLGWRDDPAKAIKTIKRRRSERLEGDGLEEASFMSPRRGMGEEMTHDVSERVILATFVSIIILAFVFVSVAWTCPECMPWYRPDARHILW